MNLCYMVHVGAVVLLVVLPLSMFLDHLDIPWPDRCLFGKFVSECVSFPVEMMTCKTVKKSYVSMYLIQYVSQCVSMTCCRFVYPIANNF